LNVKFSLLPLLTLFLFFSCEDKPDCFKSTGEIVKEERSLDRYTTVFLKDNLNLILVDDTIQNLTIEAGKHLLSEIKTEVKDGQLFISNDNSCNWVRSYKKPLNIYLSLKTVKGIFHYGSGNISCRETIHKDTIIFHHYSSGNMNVDIYSNYIWLDMDKLGDLRLTGKTNTLLSRTIGLGKLDTDGLSCKQFYQTSDGKGDSNIRSDSLLVVEINNSGTIYYTGNPVTVLKTGSGPGNLIKK
jgi:hypothetical protein